MDLPSRTTWESDIFRLSIFYFHHFFEFLEFLNKLHFLFSVFFFLSPVCPLVKPPRNWITISPPDSDSKQPHSFLRINKVHASQPKAQLVSFKLALKTCYACLRCVFCVCVCVCVCDDGNLNEVLSWKYGYISIDVGLEVKMMPPQAWTR